MSLLQTKPKWFHGECIATRRGWENPANNEVLVAIGNLKVKLELELAKKVKQNVETKPVGVVETLVVETPVLLVEAPVVVVEDPVVIEEEIIKVKEIKVEVQEIKKKLLPTKKAKVIGEVTEQTITGGRQIIAEVVEYDLDKPIIGE